MTSRTHEGGQDQASEGQGRENAATDGIPAIIHAAEVASLEDKCEPALGLPRDEVAVELRYPGAKNPER